MKKKTTITLFLTMLLVLSMLSGCGKTQGVTIGSKQFTENILLGEIYAQLIEAKTDIPVTRKLNLGGTAVCHLAAQKGEIDMYFEYTGTAYNELLNHALEAGVTKEEILAICQKELNENSQLTLFDPLRFNNTYAVAVKTSRIEELGVETLSDLSTISDQIKFGAGHAFYTRLHDGYNGLVDTYGMKFKETLKMDTSLLYEAAHTGDLDAIIVFTTDGLLKKYELTCLVDDKTLFPPYEGSILCRNDVLERYPELRDVLNTLAGKIDDETMQMLNYQVDIENRSVEEVAKEFLISNGYISITDQDNSKIYTEQEVLDIAYKEAGINSSQASEIEVELKTKDSVEVYEIEFDYDGYEYDYVINAKTGEILSKSREKEELPTT